MWSARHGHLAIVETLLANGLNLLQTDLAGLTVYDHAQETSYMAQRGPWRPVKAWKKVTIARIPC